MEISILFFMEKNPCARNPRGCAEGFWVDFRGVLGGVFDFFCAVLEVFSMTFREQIREIPGNFFRLNFFHTKQ